MLPTTIRRLIVAALLLLATPASAQVASRTKWQCDGTAQTPTPKYANVGPGMTCSTTGDVVTFDVVPPTFAGLTGVSAPLGGLGTAGSPLTFAGLTGVSAPLGGLGTAGSPLTCTNCCTTDGCTFIGTVHGTVMVLSRTGDQGIIDVQFNGYSGVKVKGSPAASSGDAAIVWCATTTGAEDTTLQRAGANSLQLVSAAGGTTFGQLALGRLAVSGPAHTSANWALTGWGATPTVDYAHSNDSNGWLKITTGGNGESAGPTAQVLFTASFPHVPNCWAWLETNDATAVAVQPFTSYGTQTVAGVIFAFPSTFTAVDTKIYLLHFRCDAPNA